METEHIMRVKAFIAKLESRLKELRGRLLYVSSYGRYEYIQAMITEIQQWLEYWKKETGEE